MSLHIFEMLFNCYINRLYMRVLKLGKYIVFAIFPQVLGFQCEASGHVRFRRPDDQVTRLDVRGYAEG
jgi:hypothetical protein